MPRSPARGNSVVPCTRRDRSGRVTSDRAPPRQFRHIAAAIEVVNAIRRDIASELAGPALTAGSPIGRAFKGEDAEQGVGA